MKSLVREHLLRDFEANAQAVKGRSVDSLRIAQRFAAIQVQRRRDASQSSHDTINDNDLDYIERVCNDVKSARAKDPDKDIPFVFTYGDVEVHTGENSHITNCCFAVCNTYARNCAKDPLVNDALVALDGKLIINIGNNCDVDGLVITPCIKHGNTVVINIGDNSRIYDSILCSGILYTEDCTCTIDEQAKLFRCMIDSNFILKDALNPEQYGASLDFDVVDMEHPNGCTSSLWAGFYCLVTRKMFIVPRTVNFMHAIAISLNSNINYIDLNIDPKPSLVNRLPLTLEGIYNNTNDKKTDIHIGKDALLSTSNICMCAYMESDKPCEVSLGDRVTAHRMCLYSIAQTFEIGNDLQGVSDYMINLKDKECDNPKCWLLISPSIKIGNTAHIQTTLALESNRSITIADNFKTLPASFCNGFDYAVEESQSRFSLGISYYPLDMNALGFIHCSTISIGNDVLITGSASCLGMDRSVINRHKHKHTQPYMVNIGSFSEVIMLVQYSFDDCFIVKTGKVAIIDRF